jgi:murein DD-endopeptidase MepM/ murein hydrolase activator NlpD
LRTLDGAVDGNAVALPSAGGATGFGRKPSRPSITAHIQSRFAGFIGDGDFVVDLGRDIGSAHWWRGAITALLLTGSALYMGARVVPMQSAPTPAYTPAQQIEASAQAIAPIAAQSATGRRLAPTTMVRPLAETPERPQIEVAATLRQGSEIERTLRSAGVGADDANAAASLVSGAIGLSSINRGAALDITLGRRPNKDVPRPLDSLAFRAAFDLRLAISRVGGELRLKRIPIAVNDTPMRISGTVGSSLYKSARAAGVPANLVAEFIKALSFGVDFQRDVGSNAKFDIIFEHRLAETGETETGKLLYAGLDRGGKKLQMMRWTLGSREQFFDASGEATQKGLMRTPVDGARLTSGFGMRLHPLLGYSRMHKGVDFGAAYGSPILAAAAGRIEYAGWHGGHGKFVKINHGNGLQTGYAHMSRFIVASGQRVSQGQVIGYVGSTGMSTGPHLHYELYRGGKAVDPRSVKFTSRTQLAGKDLRAFKAKLGGLMGVKAGPKATPGQGTALAQAGMAGKKTRG